FEFEREAVKESSIFNYGFIISITYDTVLKDGFIDAEEPAFLKENHPKVYKKILESEHRSKLVDGSDGAIAGAEGPDSKNRAKKPSSFQISDLDARIIKTDILKSRNSSIKK
ncbi:MAG: hypothetical protein HRU09_16605, partial [Oligoflexales bacterium]|nr:hypothetical protein [Oligoflexales bacterium]